jgi:hypothetical protein
MEALKGRTVSSNRIGLENRLRNQRRLSGHRKTISIEGLGARGANKLRRTPEGRGVVRAYCDGCSELCSSKSANALRQ